MKKIAHLFKSFPLIPECDFTSFCKKQVLNCQKKLFVWKYYFD